MITKTLNKVLLCCLMVSLVILSFLGKTQTLLNKEKAKIYAIDIPGIFQQDKQGAYDKVLQKTRILNKLATLEIYPPARAQLMFKYCTNCCFTPANALKQFYFFDNNVVETDAMNIAKIYIFVKEGRQPINKLSALKGKNIGARTGMPYGNILKNTQFNIDYVDTIEQNIKKLALGRIDAFIAYVPDAYNVFNKLNMKPLPHNKAKPLAIHPDRLVCKNVDHSLISTFNKNLNKLKENKNLKTLLGNSYIKP